MRIILLLSILVSPSAFAAPSIFVVGGALSTTPQLKGCYPSYNVAGINQAGGLKAALVKALQSPDGAVLAGHSNGWGKVVVPMALSIEPKLRANLTLVNLDGGGSGSVKGKGFRKVRCVNAKNSGGGTSRNFNGTQAGCEEPMTITNAKAGAGWALHFAVMNANVPPNLCEPDSLGGRPAPPCWWGYHGFDNCSPITSWARP